MYIFPAPFAPVPMLISAAAVLIPVPMNKSPDVCPAPKEISPVCGAVPPMVILPDVKFEPMVITVSNAFALIIGTSSFVSIKTLLPYKLVYEFDAVPILIPIAAFNAA